MFLIMISISQFPTEWATVRPVNSRDPVWQLKRERGGRLPEPPRVSGKGIHLPRPSYWPLVTAVGVPGIFLGLMLSPKVGPWGIAAGLAILLFGVFNWVFDKGYSELTTTGRGVR
jgi:hypothetical protein